MLVCLTEGTLDKRVTPVSGSSTFNSRDSWLVSDTCIWFIDGLGGDGHPACRRIIRAVVGRLRVATLMGLGEVRDFFHNQCWYWWGQGTVRQWVGMRALLIIARSVIRNSLKGKLIDTWDEAKNVWRKRLDQKELLPILIIVCSKCLLRAAVRTHSVNYLSSFFFNQGTQCLMPAYHFTWKILGLCLCYINP